MDDLAHRAPSRGLQRTGPAATGAASPGGQRRDAHLRWARSGCQGAVLSLAALALACTVEAPGVEAPAEEAGADDEGVLVLGDQSSAVEEAYQVLRRVGYFPNAELAHEYHGWQPLIPIDPEDPSVLDEVMEEALLLFQHAHGLKETGTLSAETRSALQTPRCGVPDYYPPSPRVTERLQAHVEHATAAHYLFDVEDMIRDTPDPQAFVASGYAWPHTELSYGFGAATADTTIPAQRQALVAALQTWTAQAPLIVTERPNPDLLWSFVPVHHAPNHTFPWGILAHNQYPYGCYWNYGDFTCPADAGDMHINDQSYTWGVGNGSNIQDIQTIALHELGHAFGLDHSPEPGSVMGSYTHGSQVRSLGADDIAGIRALYPVFRDMRMFDASFYLYVNSDLNQAFGGNLWHASWHWIQNGRFEGRAASPVFMVKEYLAANPDIAAAYGTDYPAATWHWRHLGLAEGRRGSPAFHAPDYLNRHVDVRNAFGSANYGAALRHWLEAGLNEGRRASPLFDPKHYLLANPDVANACGGFTQYRCGLRHWLLAGRAEGRSAAP